MSVATHNRTTMIMRTMAIAIVGSFLYAAFFGTQVYADNRPAYNQAEVNARQRCFNEPDDRRGAIWFTNSADYYADSVYVSSGTTSVTVGIHGSVYSCGQSPAVHTGATNIAPVGPNGYRLNGLSSTTLDRGTVSGRNNWSSTGSSVSATLDVSGLAMNNTAGQDSQSIIVDLYRCYYDFSGGQGSCYSEPITVTVVRERRPDPTWSLENGSFLKVRNNGNENSDSGWVAGNATANIGDYVYWKHQIRNAGPNDTNRNIRWVMRGQDFPADYSPNLPGETADVLQASNTGSAPAGGYVAQIGKYGGGNAGFAVYQIRADDAGKTLCQRVEYTPVNWTGAGVATSDYRCVTISFSYALTPNIPSFASTVTPGQTVTVTPTVAKTGTNSGPTNYTVAQIVVRPGVAPAGASTSGGPGLPAGAGGGACGYYRSIMPAGSVLDCDEADSGNRVFTTSSTVLGAIPASIPEYPVGTRICFTLSVFPNSAATPTTWAHSSMTCALIAKSPLFEARSGDIRSGGKIQTSTSTRSGLTYGSWAEYGALSYGVNTGYASGAGLFEGDGSANQSAWSKLTFANTGGSYGQFIATTPLGAAQNIESKLVTTGATTIGGGVYNLTSAGAGRTEIRRNGDLTLQNNATGVIPLGKSIVIKVTGTVTITQNITYPTGAIGSVALIPQVVIIANKIRIDPSVVNVSAWLIADPTDPTVRGVIDTCAIDDAGTASLTSNVCNNRLNVYGPVITDRLWLRRTAGADPSSPSSPAEVFTLGPDAYLWARNYINGTTGKAITTYQTELPVRY